jgi:hypothetical protein
VKGRTGARETANLTDSRTPDEIQTENNRISMEKGPGLRYSYGTYVVAKDSKTKRVLLGGLGAMGVGQMWFSNASGSYNDRPGYAEAPEQDAPKE